MRILQKSWKVIEACFIRMIIPRKLMPAIHGLVKKTRAVTLGREWQRAMTRPSRIHQLAG